jgi:hypothetical protein
MKEIERKAALFEKSAQKLLLIGTKRFHRPWPRGIKSFLVLFSKKNFFPSLILV